MGRRDVYAVEPDIQKLIRKARKRGWQVELTNGGHLRWVDPGGKVTVTAQTGNHRTRARIIVFLRRGGVV